MAGSKLNNYSSTDNNITQMQLTADALLIGCNLISLTNFESTNTSAPAIAAGSIGECNGALYKFSTENVIGGSTSDGSNYIKLVPSSSQVTAEYSTVTPVWIDSRQGYYESTSSNNRFIGGVDRSSGVFQNKYKLVSANSLSYKVYSDSIKLADFREITADTINVRNLNMYAYGNKALITLTSTADFYFNILKPVQLYSLTTSTAVAITDNLYEVLTVSSQLLGPNPQPSNGYTNSGANYLKWVNRLYPSTADPNSIASYTYNVSNIFLPGRYMFRYGSSSNNRTIYCSYVEGTNDINLSSVYFSS